MDIYPKKWIKIQKKELKSSSVKILLKNSFFVFGIKWEKRPSILNFEIYHALHFKVFLKCRSFEMQKRRKEWSYQLQ